MPITARIDRVYYYFLFWSMSYLMTLMGRSSLNCRTLPQGGDWDVLALGSSQSSICIYRQCWRMTDSKWMLRCSVVYLCVHSPSMSGSWWGFRALSCSILTKRIINCMFNPILDTFLQNMIFMISWPTAALNNNSLGQQLTTFFMTLLHWTKL